MTITKRTVARLDTDPRDLRESVRFTAATETSEPLPASASASPITLVRLKSRWSYNHKGEFCFDLTEVRAGRDEREAGGANPEYEVEVEWIGGPRWAASGGAFPPGAAPVFASKFLGKVADLVAMKREAEAARGRGGGGGQGRSVAVVPAPAPPPPSRPPAFAVPVPAPIPTGGLRTFPSFHWSLGNSTAAPAAAAATSVAPVEKTEGSGSASAGADDAAVVPVAAATTLAVEGECEGGEEGEGGDGGGAAARPAV